MDPEVKKCAVCGNEPCTCPAKAEGEAPAVAPETTDTTPAPEAAAQ